MNSKKFLVIDIETLNGTDDALSYDVGYQIVDKHENVYVQRSFVIYDMFFTESDLMQSAYYACKIPLYLMDIQRKRRQVVNFLTAWKIIREDMAEHGVTEVYAYNANFDYSGLNRTLRYITKSKYRYFFPYGTEICCIWHMACQVICTQKTFYKEAIKNGWVSPSGNFSTSAETVYKYITGQEDFEEAHTGLEDVQIETEILFKCFRQHKKMDKSINRNCWRIPTKFYKENYVDEF